MTNDFELKKVLIKYRGRTARSSYCQKVGFSLNRHPKNILLKEGILPFLLNIDLSLSAKRNKI